jgi:poly-beta-1,6-N-acetyl-D-glucosamine synthase
MSCLDRSYCMHFNLFDLLILVVLSLTFLGQLWLWWYFQFKLLAYKTPEMVDTEDNAVSIIICAKNEAKNLKLFLPKVLEQQYKQFEVVVVNDCSEDETIDVLQQLQAKYAHLKVCTIQADEYFEQGKKWALTLGIKAAQYPYLLLTDADCYPISNKWLQLMRSQFNAKTDIVLGYGKYETQNHFLNRLIRYDTMTIAANYLGYAVRHKTYMGVGRNLAYKKTLFFAHKGFATHQHMMSGDDDLFISEAATPENVAIEIIPEAFTVSLPKTSWKDWIYQKARHVSTATQYKKKTQFLMAMQYGVQYLFYIFLLVGLFNTSVLYLSLSLFIVRISILSILNFRLSKVLKEGGIWYYSVIFELLFLILYFIFQYKNRFEKQGTWKN